MDPWRRSPRPIGVRRNSWARWGNSPFPRNRPPRMIRGSTTTQLFRESIADAWTSRLVTAVRRGDPRHLVTVGHIQWASTVYLPSVQHYAAFNLRDNARYVDFVTIHFYPIAPPKPGDSPEGIDVNAQYLEDLLRDCAAGKPVMIGEFAWYGGGDIQVEGRVIMPAQTWEDQVAWCDRLLQVSRGRVCALAESGPSPIRRPAET